jgi:3-deoxy-7-phosphoheptulonate synthase
MTQAVETPTIPQDPLAKAASLVDGLPGGEYRDYYQPYRTPLPGEASRQDLIEAVHELQNTQGVTINENITALRNVLAAVAAGEVTDPVVITGRCSEPVDAETSIESLVKESLQMLGIAKRGLGSVITILRNRGQNGKPRSSEYQTLADGGRVLTHMGDMVNGADESKRQPDPSRLVAAAVQARDVEVGLTERSGHHVPAAHEALVLPYEESFIRADADGKLWSHAADLLWIGDRTRDPDGPHVELLSRIENPVGVKLGPSAAAADIEALYARLNPRQQAGKVVFMLRTGLENEAITASLLDAIKSKAPNSVLLYDIHGSTMPGPAGQKIRAVSRIVAEVEQLNRLCNDRGLQLHGVHLETQPSGTRRECVDEAVQLPADVPVVDPLLNRHQTLRIYHRLGKLIANRQAAA